VQPYIFKPFKTVPKGRFRPARRMPLSMSRLEADNDAAAIEVAKALFAQLGDSADFAILCDMDATTIWDTDQGS
jgi:hypothetical protein